MSKGEQYYQMSFDETIDHFKSNKNGLSTKEATERLKIYGKNTLKEINKTPSWIKFLAQFKDVLIILLIVSMIISIYLQDYRGATILGIIVIVNAVIGYVQEAKAEKIMESLKKMLFPTAKVKRNGKLIEEKGENLVPGDIVYLEEGANIPADVRIIEESEFQTNDFSLTGESNPMNKFTHTIPGEVPLGERNNCTFMGTTVATGYARGIVIATGMYTELGKIANLSQEQTNEETPLQIEMKNVAKKLTIGTIILCGVLLTITLFGGFSVREAFIFAIGIAASMVPQGLPAQVSIALSLAAGRLAKNRALIKQLASVETLGCVNIICTDKTGTLTKNEMTVKKVFLGNQRYDIQGSGYETKEADKITNISSEQRKHFFYTGILASNAKINQPDSEHPTRYCIGDPTEGALITLGQKAGFNTEQVSQKNTQYHQFGFDSVRKMMSSIRTVEGKTIVYVKGAPNELLERCTQINTGKFIKKITPSDLKTIQTAIDESSSDAMRNIAFAYKEIPCYDKTTPMDDVESDLIFLGFVAIIDPAREEVPAAIQAARNAKIKIIMITGDYGPTAEAIAEKIGLDDGKMKLIPGDELRKMADIHLSNEIKEYRSLIFSRTSPEDKLRIVNLLKKTHNVVAVTGDGINDAPALKCADIGVAMGKIGTDVAKEASEIVLLDDSFHTLVGAISEGRIIYQNLKKTVISCITSNGGELFAVLSSLVGQAFFHIPMAINPVQILCIDLIGEMGPLTALTWDPAQSNLMKQAPRDTKEHIINKFVIIDLIRSGALMGFMGYCAYLLYLLVNNITAGGLSTTSTSYMTANAVTYTTIMFCQYANILSRRAGTQESALTSYFRSNKKLFWSIGIGFLAMLVLIYMPVVHEYFGFEAMQIQDWIFPLVGGILFFAIREFYKIFVRKYKRSE